MQLYELGEIDLEANVNDYISGFKIPDTFPKPITIENLLTHTPGFEETSYNPIQFEEYTMQPLGEALKQMPERAFEPGEFAAYANYGMALAGYIVQEVSGVEFSDYVDGRNESPTSFEKITIPPAGSITSSAGDMAKFIIANIQKGEFEGERILNEETAELMQSVHFRHDPRLNGMCYGFYEMSMNGLRLIGHGGDTGLFHSLLVFSPEDNWGLFVSFNSNGKGSARDALLNAFIDRFYPADRSIERKEVLTSIR
jgi:CubicO group peptidase (beta-lactamase class C family)